MARRKLLKEFVPGRGYTKEDWDEVGDSPILTKENAALMRPFKEWHPELYDALTREAARKSVDKRGKDIDVRALKEADPDLHAAIILEKAAVKEAAPRKTPAKVRVSLRIDSDTLEAFKATGKGWQTRMNDALKSAAPKAA